MDNTDKTPATEESVWAAFRETDRRQKETDRQMKETDLQIKQAAANFDIELAKSSAEFRQQLAESSAKADKEMSEIRQRMAEINKTIGGWANGIGDFAEEYFFNSFEQGKRNFFGEEFDEIAKNMPGYRKNYKDEYDIVLFNGKSLAIVEIKFKAREKDLLKVVKKAETFRINYPDYKNHKIFLGLATMAFDPEVEQECKEQGIAVIKQVGDTIFISGDNLKTF